MTWKEYRSNMYSCECIHTYIAEENTDDEYIKIEDDYNSFKLECYKDDLIKFWLILKNYKLFSLMRHDGETLGAGFATNYARKFFKFKKYCYSNNIQNHRVVYVLKEIKRLNDEKKYFNYEDTFDFKKFLKEIPLASVLELVKYHNKRKVGKDEKSCIS